MRPLYQMEDDSQQAWEMAAGSSLFLPSSLSEVTCWIRVAQGTITGAGYSSVPDVLNVNPLTQGTDGNRPTATASANGYPLLTFDGTDNWLSWPVITANNGSVRWGVAFWIKFASVVGLHTLVCAETTVGTSAAKLNLQQNGDDLFLDVYTSAGNSRRGTIADVLGTASQVFVTAEYDGDQTLESDKCVITLNNVKQTLAFVNSGGTPPGSTMPATLIVPTGTMAIGVQNTATNLRPLSAVMGPNIYALTGAGGLSGGGLLTSAKRAALMGFEQPT